MDRKLNIVPAYDHKEDLKELFVMYTDMLIEGEPEFKIYLEMQKYNDELVDPEEKYGMPYGRLYLAYMDGEPVGCIGLRRIDDKNCELKRMYVKPDFRGRRIGHELLGMLIEEAKKIGYDKMLLDTLPFLKRALKMYQDFGFETIERYNDSPLDSSIYMKLEL